MKNFLANGIANTVYKTANTEQNFQDGADGGETNFFCYYKASHPKAKVLIELQIQIWLNNDASATNDIWVAMTCRTESGIESTNEIFMSANDQPVSQHYVFSVPCRWSIEPGDDHMHKYYVYALPEDAADPDEFYIRLGDNDGGSAWVIREY